MRVAGGRRPRRAATGDGAVPGDAGPQRGPGPGRRRGPAGPGRPTRPSTWSLLDLQLGAASGLDLADDLERPAPACACCSCPATARGGPAGAGRPGGASWRSRSRCRRWRPRSPLMAALTTASPSRTSGDGADVAGYPALVGRSSLRWDRLSGCGLGLGGAGGWPVCAGRSRAWSASASSSATEETPSTRPSSSLASSSREPMPMMCDLRKPRAFSRVSICTTMALRALSIWSCCLSRLLGQGQGLLVAGLHPGVLLAAQGPLGAGDVALDVAAQVLVEEGLQPLAHGGHAQERQQELAQLGHLVAQEQGLDPLVLVGQPADLGHHLAQRQEPLGVVLVQAGQQDGHLLLQPLARFLLLLAVGPAAEGAAVGPQHQPERLGPQAHDDRQPGLGGQRRTGRRCRAGCSCTG